VSVLLVFRTLLTFWLAPTHKGPSTLQQSLQLLLIIFLTSPLFDNWVAKMLKDALSLEDIKTLKFVNILAQPLRLK
jgi:hypothetical protein